MPPKYKHIEERDWILFKPSVGRWEFKNLAGNYTYSKTRGQIEWADFRSYDVNPCFNTKPVPEFGDSYGPSSYIQVVFKARDKPTNSRVVTAFVCKAGSSDIHYECRSVRWRKQIPNHINIASKSLIAKRYRGVRQKKDEQCN